MTYLTNLNKVVAARQQSYLQELDKVIDSKQQHESEGLTALLKKLRGKPFWVEDPIIHRQLYHETKGECCFWDLIGRPYKHGKKQPVYDYELNLIKTLEVSKYVWCLKAVGLGITEFCLRWIVWKCTTNDDWRNRQVPIIVGPNTDLAIKLIKRIRRMFESHNVHFLTIETYLNINGVDLECFSSHHLDSFRSLESPACVYMSEADFFPRSQQTDVRHISERYISKSSPWIIMESTPNAPGGLFETINKEDPCLYTKLRLDYTYGLRSGIYTSQEIQNAMKSPSFEREHNLKFLGKIGNTFRTEDIERAQSNSYDPDLIPTESSRVIACDPSWGSSNFGVLVSDFRDGKASILFASEYSNETSENMVELVRDLYHKYAPVSAILIDGSQISWIKSLKIAMFGELREDPDFQKSIQFYKDNHCDWKLNMRIQPILFNEANNKAMLSHLREMLSGGYLMIDKRFQTLLLQLHQCTDQEGHVLKDQMSAGSDVFDCARMAMGSYEFT